MAKQNPIMIIDPAKAAALETDPSVVVLKHDKLGDQIAVRLPTRAQWRKFKADITSDVPDRKELATEALLLDVVVFPEREELRAYFEKRPAAPEVFAQGVGELVGFGGRAEKKE
jgi:hypothetical protein